MTPPRIAWGAIGAVVAAKLAIHALSSGPLAWGYMTDELYFLDCSDRLAWGYVDHPPFSVALLLPVRALLGDSIPALHVLPALFSAAAVLLTGILAHELGGGRTAQGLAALALLSSPVSLALGTYYSMNPIDQALWAGGFLLLARILNGGSDRLWLALGLLVGVGLLNKVSMAWFGAGLGAGLVLTRERRRLATPWPWIAGAIAIALVSPFVGWQQQHGWPFFEFSREAAKQKVGAVSPWALLEGQILAMNPLAAPLWIAGLVASFTSPALARYRPLAWIFVTTVGILAASGSARIHYLAPAYPVLLAAGAIVVERAGAAHRWLPRAAAIALALSGLIALPLVVPLISPPATVAYEKALGISLPQERESSGVLPMHLALFQHAEATLDAVTRGFETLSPEERARVEILTSSFGETGAIDRLGPRRGLPSRSIGIHNQYWLWGPGDATGQLMLVVHESQAELERWFRQCDRVAEIECPYCMPMLSAESVFLCRDARRPLRELWPEMKLYR
ncbi:MAG TPA: glycosyltransferase family 39 protein [Myxococcota bacterium]|nr:glycosyltransferase family 39 protein [Myxococcota bacterium]